MNLLITKDDENENLGSFFSRCADFAVSVFCDSASITLLPSQKLKNDIIFSLKIKSFDSFNFFAFTHGNEDGLIVDEKNYVDCKKDISDFSVANIVYNFSCLSGVNFGKELVSAGAKCFIGHNKTIYIQTLPKFQNYFFEPFKVFISNLANVKDVDACIKSAKEKYTEEIDNLYPTDMLTASVLLDNRDSLVCYGNTSVHF